MKQFNEEDTQEQESTLVKYPLRGFDREQSLLASSRPMFIAISMEGSDPLSMSTIGTQNGWDASAFTRGNEFTAEPLKHYSVVSVQGTTITFFSHCEKAEEKEHTS